MPPPCLSFPAAELPRRAQLDVDGRRRKPPPGSRSVDLAACDLARMLQYRCHVSGPARDSPVECFAVERLFRRCSDKKGAFLLETTAWEKATPADPRRRPAAAP